jgi:protein MpaA
VEPRPDVFRDGDHPETIWHETAPVRRPGDVMLGGVGGRDDRGSHELAQDRPRRGAALGSGRGRSFGITGHRRFWSLLLVAAALGIAAGDAAGRPTDPLGLRTVALGRSVEGRPITAVETGDFDSPEKVLVVGCIHGNEPAGIAIAQRLARVVPSRVDLWIIPDLNPDGRAADTRQNAHGVDLNRNFPWNWRALEGVEDSGGTPLSEPESRLAYRLILRLKPRLSIWFHQHLTLVDDSEGSVPLERKFARLVGLPLLPLTDYPGSATAWETHRLAGATAFVVELPAGPLPPAAVSRYARAVIAVS